MTLSPQTMAAVREVHAGLKLENDLCAALHPGVHHADWSKAFSPAVDQAGTIFELHVKAQADTEYQQRHRDHPDPYRAPELSDADHTLLQAGLDALRLNLAKQRADLISQAAIERATPVGNAAHALSSALRESIDAIVELSGRLQNAPLYNHSKSFLERE